MKSLLSFMMMGFIGVFLLGAQMLCIRAYERHLSLRQPIKGPSVQHFTSDETLKIILQAAHRTAAELDKQLPFVLKVTSMGPLQKWSENIDSDYVERKFSQEVMMHMKDMTNLFRSRRELGGFKKLQEFAFQSTLSKSDYLLSLQVTLSSLIRANHNRLSSELMKETLASYNQERILFDKKMINL